MRIAAAVLVVLGSLLTVTIAWATIGLLFMGFGLLCGLIADHWAARASGHRPSQFAKAKSSRTPVRPSAPVVAFCDVLPLRSFSSGDGSSVSARRSLAEPSPIAWSNPATDFENSVDFSEHAITTGIENRAVYDADFEQGVPFADDGASLLPGMMSLVVQAVRGGLQAVERGELNRQVHEVDAGGHEWVHTVDEPIYRSAEELTDLSGDGSMEVGPSLLVLKELAEISAAHRENVEEAEQLIGLFDKMSKPKPLARDDG